MRMDVAELGELIARAQQREASAFDALVQRYGPRLYGYFYRATGRRADAEDLLQDLFVKLVSMIGFYQHDGRFDAWLFCVATNLVRDRIRRAKASRKIRGQQGGPDLNDCITRAGHADHLSDQPHDRLRRAEDVDKLNWAIQQLPEAERMVVLLRHFSQLSFQQIADLMETPLGTALARAHRGLAKLRELMTE
jgi:RNA polymerase sigma-70 factor, ECF subfamily